MTDAIAAGAPVEPLARYFEYWLLRLQGVYPSLSSCPGAREPLTAGAVMPPRDDMFVCRTCAPAGGGTRHVAEALRFLKAAGATAPDRLESLALPASRGARARNRAPAPDEPASREGTEIRPGAARDAAT